MTGSNADVNFNALMKCVLSDYPYPLAIEHSKQELLTSFRDVFNDVLAQHAAINNSYFSTNGRGIIDLRYMDHYLILCFRYANRLFKQGGYADLCDALYFSSRLRTSTDFYYKADIGRYFIPVHPLGTVIDSHAQYGEGFRVYNGVHIGPYDVMEKESTNWSHPVIGDGVILYAKSGIYGKTFIGSNVIVTVGCQLVNEDIPENCVVIGSTPNVKVVPNKYENMAIIRPR